MAFCNSCGASISAGTRFCSKCGAPILASSPTPGTVPSAAAGSTMPAASSPPVPAQGGGALKAILIVVGVIVLAGILGVASLGFFAWRFARHAHVRQDGNNVTVETPFGSVQTTRDPEEAARALGVDLYPGAEVSKSGAQSATIGGIHTASLDSESTDSVDSVASFYKAKFPHAVVTSSDAGRCTILSNDRKSVITINIEARGGKTKIQITNVTHESGGNSPSN